MKKRTQGFLSEENIDQNGEVFNYIQELHEYLWGFVRTVKPYASGNLSDFVDLALSETLSYEVLKDQRDRAIVIIRDINDWLVRSELSGTAHQRLLERFIKEVDA